MLDRDFDEDDLCIEDPGNSESTGTKRGVGASFFTLGFIDLLNSSGGCPRAERGGVPLADRGGVPRAESGGIDDTGEGLRDGRLEPVVACAGLCAVVEGGESVGMVERVAGRAVGRGVGWVRGVIPPPALGLPAIAPNREVGCPRAVLGLLPMPPRAEMVTGPLRALFLLLPNVQGDVGRFNRGTMTLGSGWTRITSSSASVFTSHSSSFSHSSRWMLPLSNAARSALSMVTAEAVSVGGGRGGATATSGRVTTSVTSAGTESQAISSVDEKVPLGLVGVRGVTVPLVEGVNSGLERLWVIRPS